jgi:hypothetical protein
MLRSLKPAGFVLMLSLSALADQQPTQPTQPPQNPPPPGQTQPIPQQPLVVTPLNRDQIMPACNQDIRIRTQQQQTANQLAFLSRSRVDTFLKRAAAVVKTRYMAVAQPAYPLGRLVAPPFCGGVSGNGMVVPNFGTSSQVRISDISAFPKFQNCYFIFETFPPANSNTPVSTEGCLTALGANIRVNLDFDQTSLQRPGSDLRIVPPGAAQNPNANLASMATKFGIELEGEPFVLQARPNVAPPMTLFDKDPFFVQPRPNSPMHFMPQSQLPPVPVCQNPSTDPENLPALASLEVDDVPAVRLALATHLIAGHENGVVDPNSVREAILTPSGLSFDGSDPCGEADPLPLNSLVGPFAPLAFDQRCYTYRTRYLDVGAPLSDSAFLGQIRVAFQRDTRTGKLIGIRAYSFGGDL